jgi:DNA-binding CsgD family transcriptional regulator
MAERELSRFSKLTEREVEFLVLYDQPLLIKEIAFRCGVGEPTVHKAFESARRKLGTRTTREAARLVVEWHEREKSIAGFHTLGSSAESAMLTSSDEDREGFARQDAPSATGEHENRSSTARSWGILSVLWGGGQALSPVERAAAIVLLAFLIVIVSGMLVTIGRGLGYAVAAAVHALR